ncbi:rod shape-determining protein MreC [Candidatus Pelagibacter communis]|uniref:rod shape-determining protein MreC n=1 Tax=Pelagibacter ubique TaxID=198252 RepID=UPI00094CF57E|nr:rod shape-determining protein MreC [Candidatus Pelagibacter ubique]
MSVSRDDFSIAFRSALLQRGGAQKFSVLSLIFLALIIFFLDVYGAKFTKPVRGFLNDVVYRITFLASTPTRFFPQVSKDLTKYFNVKAENEKLKAEIEKYKLLELNVEFLSDENKNLQKILETEYFNKNLSNVVLAKVLVDKNSPFLKSIIINKGTRTGILKGMPVTHNNYLVGRIVETNYLSSRVLLLNDLNSRIPVTLDQGAQAILSGGGTNNPTLEYLPEDYKVIEEINVFASGKDGIFSPGAPIGMTNLDGEVDLFVDPNQLSFVTVNLSIQNLGKL